MQPEPHEILDLMPVSVRPRGPSLTETTKAHEDSTVLWARVPDEVARQLAEAVPFELYAPSHVTVLYWPGVSGQAAEILATALWLALRTLPPARATVTGFGDFQASGCAVALVSAPGLEEYRAMARGVYEPNVVAYGFQPHVTLSLDRQPVVELPPAQWTINELEVVSGDQVLRTIPLTGDDTDFDRYCRRLVSTQRQAPTTVQTLIFDKRVFPSGASATRWAREHDFRADKLDETEGSWRIRQRDPGDFVASSFRTIRITDGVLAVVGRLR